MSSLHPVTVWLVCKLWKMVTFNGWTKFYINFQDPPCCGIKVATIDVHKLTRTGKVVVRVRDKCLWIPSSLIWNCSNNSSANNRKLHESLLMSLGDTISCNILVANLQSDSVGKVRCLQQHWIQRLRSWPTTWSNDGGKRSLIKSSGKIIGIHTPKIKGVFQGKK